MVFNYDEESPTDGSYIADFPTNERSHRTAVLNSLLVDHDVENDGHHKKVSLDVLAGKPDIVTTTGFVYTKVEDGQTELFWEDDQGIEVQLSDKGSASPDKVAIDGDTMTGVLVIEAAASAIHLENLGAKIMGRDVGDANWRALLSVDDSDVCELGDESLGGGTRIVSDGIDELVTKYPGETDKKIWHAGHFAGVPSFSTAYTSADQTLVDSDSGSVAHNLGLGEPPPLWTAHIRCTSTNRAYDPDDVIMLANSLFGSAPNGFGTWASATHFGWEVSNAVPDMLTKGGDGTNGNIDHSKWALVFRAWY
jgi:hypothetical protein